MGKICWGLSRAPVGSTQSRQNGRWTPFRQWTALASCVYTAMLHGLIEEERVANEVRMLSEVRGG